MLHTGLIVIWHFFWQKPINYKDPQNTCKSINSQSLIILSEFTLENSQVSSNPITDCHIVFLYQSLSPRKSNIVPEKWWLKRTGDIRDILWFSGGLWSYEVEFIENHCPPPASLRVFLRSPSRSLRSDNGDQRRSTVQRRQRVGWIRNHGASPSKCILIPVKRIYHQYSQPYCIIIIVMFVSPSQTMHYIKGICAPTLPCLCIALSPRIWNRPTLKQKKNYNNSELLRSHESSDFKGANHFKSATPKTTAWYFCRSLLSEHLYWHAWAFRWLP